jgi:hypothetical protein
VSGARTWHGWAVPLPGGGTYLGVDAAQLVLFLLERFAASTGAVNGLASEPIVSPLVREVRAACEVATRGASDDGHILRTSELDQPLSPSRPDDLLTMGQVAEELHVTDRTARRLAAGDHLGLVTYAGRSKLVRRFEVDAYKNRSRSPR